MADPLYLRARKAWQESNPQLFEELSQSGQLNSLLKESVEKANEEYARAVEAGLDPADSRLQANKELFEALAPEEKPEPWEEEAGEDLQRSTFQKYLEATSRAPETPPETSTPKAAKI